MNIEQVAKELWERAGADGDDRIRLAVVGNETFCDISEQIDQLIGPGVSLAALLGSDNVPEGKVYILTEATLRLSLADWPAADVLEIGGE